MIMPCGKKWGLHVIEEHNARHNFLLKSRTTSQHKEYAVMVSVFSERKVAEMMRIIQM
jgi:hypothetical protein